MRPLDGRGFVTSEHFPELTEVQRLRRTVDALAPYTDLELGAHADKAVSPSDEFRACMARWQELMGPRPKR